MQARRDLLAWAVGATAFLPLSACTYGPVFDASRIQSAVVSSDKQSVAFAYQELRYRPATGVAAFPDGGIPRYLVDRAYIAAAPLGGGRPHVLQRVENNALPGSGSLSLRASDDDPEHLLVLRGAQVRGGSESSWWRVGWRDGRVLPYPDLEAELRARGRRLGSPKFGDVVVIDPQGDLLIGAQFDNNDEVWLRTEGGGYRLLLDRVASYYGRRGQDLYYWGGDEAVVLNWRTGERRVIARYDPRSKLTTRLAPDDPTVHAIEHARELPSDPTVSIERNVVIVRWRDGRESRIPAEP